MKNLGNNSRRRYRVNPGAQFRSGNSPFSTPAALPPVIACPVHGRIHWPLARPYCPACGREIQAYADEVEMALDFDGLPADLLQPHDLKELE